MGNTKIEFNFVSFVIFYLWFFSLSFLVVGGKKVECQPTTQEGTPFEVVAQIVVETPSFLLSLC